MVNTADITLTHTLDQATIAAREALTNCWFTNRRNSGVHDVRVACIDPAGKRVVVLMTHSGWQIQGGAWCTLTDDESKGYRTRLVIGPRGTPIVLGSVGQCWMSNGI